MLAMIVCSFPSALGTSELFASTQYRRTREKATARCAGTQILGGLLVMVLQIRVDEVHGARGGAKQRTHIGKSSRHIRSPLFSFPADHIRAGRRLQEPVLLFDNGRAEEGPGRALRCQRRLSFFRIDPKNPRPVSESYTQRREAARWFCWTAAPVRSEKPR